MNFIIAFAVILFLIVIIGFLIYRGEFRFEYRIEKNRSNSTEQTKSPLDCLSNTELTILKQVSEGKSNQEIADNLFISVHTVKKHVSNIFKKLNIKSRSETRKFKELKSNDI